MPFLTIAWTFLKSVPWQAYAVIGAVSVVAGIHFKLVHDAVVKNDKKWEVKLELVRKAQERSDAIASGKLAELTVASNKQREHAEWKLQDQAKEAATSLAALKGRMVAYVTPLQLSRCPDVPRGILLFGADAAAFANGGNPPAPPTPAESFDAPSGVPITALANTLAEQAGAYRACAERNVAWKQHQDHINQWYEQIRTIMKGTP